MVLLRRNIAALRAACNEREYSTRMSRYVKAYAARGHAIQDSVNRARGVIAAGSGSAYCPSISAVIQVAA